MKKLLLAAALLFASYGAFADQFDDLVTMLRRNGEKQGWVVRSNKVGRTIFIDIKLPQTGEGVTLTQAQFDELKPMFVEMFRKSVKEENVPAFKSWNITIQWNFVTTDGKVFKLAIAPRDL